MGAVLGHLSGAIRAFAALKGGEENADDIVMQVLGKLVDVLRSGQYTPEKGKFHSYLATMIVNEVHMAHRKDVVRQVYRAYALEGEDIADVAKKFGISRNFVSQIKARIDKRIVAAGREMIAKEGL